MTVMMPARSGLTPAQIVDADDAGRNQEQIRAQPRGGRGKAGRLKAKARDKTAPHNRPSDHLQHTGENGEGAETHALNGETNDVQRRGQRQKIDRCLAVPQRADNARELRRAGYVDAYYGNNDVRNCFLTTEAVQELEKLPADTMRAIADFIGNFVP